MRRALWFLIPLTALLSVPVTAQDPPTVQVIAKIKLTDTQPAKLWAAITAVPAGMSGVLVYPLDNSLIVRGTPAAIAEAKAALRVIDVPLQGDRLEVTLRNGNPEAVRTAALGLPQAGTVQVQGKSLTFLGNEEWMRAVKGVVFGVELTDPLPREGRDFGFGNARPAPVPDSFEVVLPDGRKVKFAAVDVTLQGGQKVKVWMPVPEK